jgi:predicted PhzF superfamily epimerase YddE/YHI9
MPMSVTQATWPALLVEAFTERACGGNGAAVVLLDRPVAPQTLQKIASSLNQSETAFLWHHPSGWLLRWFTPACEVQLCGHATLAATLALGHWGRLAAGCGEWLHTRSGPLEVTLGPEDTSSSAAIVLPSSGLVPATATPALQTYLMEHLGATSEGYWYSPLGYRVVLLPATAPLAGASLPAGSLPAEEQGGLVLMQPFTPELATNRRPQVLGKPCDYQLRFLAPGLGIPEDPVTGSAHALVAPWWQEQLAKPLVVGWQCSHRPGGMHCEGVSSGMIRLSGSGHLLWDGTLRIGCNSSVSSDGAGWSSLLA